MGLLAQGEAWLRTQRAKEARSVTVRRGVLSVSLMAVQAQTRAETDNGEVIVDAHVVDWLVERADLILAATEVEPQPGDLIESTYDHGLEQFRVVHVGAEPCWRWHGRDGGTYRIHSVRV